MTPSAPNTPSKSVIEQIEKTTLDIIENLDQIQSQNQLDQDMFDRCRARCIEIPRQIKSGYLKVAVTGVVKSGKSTFVNSVLQKELVKRGAGVVTAITTRIREGRKNRANLVFKTWDEINSQVAGVLRLFPEEQFQDGASNENRNSGQASDHSERKPLFDIRRSQDRQHLASVYAVLKSDSMVSLKGIAAEALLIHHVLNGYETCKDFVGSDETSHGFEGKEFNRHKVFTADHDNAFFLKDVCLELSGWTMGSNLEIADCQGADSTDPSQLAQVLAYLENANIIVYCISSRTGLRQADIRLLNRIRQMGLLNQIIFVNNCDLSEHDTIDDLIKIEKAIINDLSFLSIEPVIFSFSTLYTLLSSLKTRLSRKDQNRLALWQTDKKMLRYCENQTEQFQLFFNRTIEEDYHQLVILNHLNRLDSMITDVVAKTDLIMDLLSVDAVKEQRASRKIDFFIRNASGTKKFTRTSFTDDIESLKREIKSDLQASLLKEGGSILRQTQDFISGITVDLDSYRENVKQVGFNQILYLIFQEVKRQIQLHGLEHVSPELKIISLRIEEQINGFFQALWESCMKDLELLDFEQNNTSVYGDENNKIGLESIDIEYLKRLAGLESPGILFEARYTPALKLNIFTRFSLKTISEIFNRLFHQRAGFSFSPALEQVVNQIKQENKRAAKEQLGQFHTTLFVHYFSPLIDTIHRDLDSKIQNHFKTYHLIQEKRRDLLSLSVKEKHEQSLKIECNQKRLIEIQKRIRDLKLAKYKVMLKEDG